MRALYLPPDLLPGIANWLATWSLLCSALLAGLARADLTAADYFVHSLPGAPDGPLLKMHAGHIEILPEHHGGLFFWHFQNRHIANRQRTVIWLNGGPGCSSEDGALMEIGPYRVKDGSKGPKLEYSDGSWDEFANVMFVDNPVGTGYSVIDTDSFINELPEMADQFVQFLEKWFAIFPEYEHDDLYIAGESYAGQFIPYIAKAILNRNRGGPAVQWALKGLLIGNGWISPMEQYSSYLTYAYEKDLVQRDSDIGRQLETIQAVCKKSLENGGSDRVDVNECEEVLQEILRLTQSRGRDGKMECYNMYDVRLKDSYPSCGMNWPPDLRDVTPYLRRHDVIEALHVSKQKQTGWTECTSGVGGAFNALNSKPSIALLPEILSSIPIILFSGAEDLICNHIGTEELISNLEWNGGKGFEMTAGTWAPRQEWTFEGQSAGFWQSARNLTYILFHGSSHMVPFDFARRTRDMLDRFMEVDIASIGGVPTDSRIDGEKGLETSVGGHPNSTAAEEAEQAKLAQAKWDAYYKSGEIVLVIVIVAAGAWGWYIYRQRWRRTGYKGIFGGEQGEAMLGARSGLGLEGFRHKNARRADVEEGFEESELEELRVRSPDGDGGGVGVERYSVGSDSDEEADVGSGHGKGRNEVGNGKQSESM